MIKAAKQASVIRKRAVAVLFSFFVDCVSVSRCLGLLLSRVCGGVVAVMWLCGHVVGWWR